MGNCKGICFSNEGVIKRPGEGSDLDQVTKKDINNGISKVKNKRDKSNENEEYDMQYYKENEDKIRKAQQKIRAKNQSR